MTYEFKFPISLGAGRRSIKGIHPAADVFPMLEGDDFANLKKDIEDHGLQHRIAIDAQGLLLDGRNRLRALLELGEEIEAQGHGFTSEDAITFIASSNIHRRHLTTSQRAAIAAELEKHYAEAARKRQAHGQTAPGKPLSANLREASAGKAAAQSAKAMNVSSRSVDSAKKVEKADAKLLEQVRQGKLTVNAAVKKISPPKKEKSKSEPAPKPKAHEHEWEWVCRTCGCKKAIPEAREGDVVPRKISQDEVVAYARKHPDVRPRDLARKFNVTEKRAKEAIDAVDAKEGKP